MTLKHLFTDKHDKIILWQKPNFLLWLWFALKVVSLVVSDELKINLGQFASAVLFAWAFLELTTGDSYFRKALGAVVISVTIISFFA